MLAARAAFRADAGYVAVAVPESTLPVLEQRLLEAVKRPLPEDAGGSRRARPSRSPRSPRRRTRSRSGPASAAATGTQELVRRAARASSTCRSSSTPTRSASSSRSSARRRPCSRRTRASSRGCSARESTWVDAHRLEAVRRAASSASAASCLLKGADTLVAAPGEGVLVVVARHAGARDRRHAATCSPASSRRSSRRASSAHGRGGRGGGRAAARLAARSPQCAALVASDVVGARCRAAARCTGLRSRSTSARCGATCGRCCARSTAPSSGPSSRRTATATARSTSPARRSTRARRALCVATVAEALELRREFPRARILVHGPDLASREVAEAREARLELVVCGRRDPGGRAACT